MTFEFKNKADRAEAFIYGDINADFGAVSASAFIDALNDASPKPLDIHIDSPGGDVFEAFAICSAIQKYEGETHAYVEGMAASAASFVATVCDEVTMSEFAWMMIHRASGCAWGNAEDLRDVAMRLDNIDNQIATIYSKRSKLTKDEALDAMAAETWYTADEALEAGLCTDIDSTAERVAAHFDFEALAKFRRTPIEFSAPAPELAPVLDELEAPEDAPAPVVEPAQESAAQIAESENEHAADTISDEKAKPPVRVLGGRAYRKESSNEQQ